MSGTKISLLGLKNDVFGGWIWAGLGKREDGWGGARLNGDKICLLPVSTQYLSIQTKINPSCNTFDELSQLYIFK